MGKSIESILRYFEVVRELRKKCPWDREQTIDTLANNLLEEVYEVIYEVENKEKEKLKEELGDLLLVLLMIFAILEEEGEDLDKIINDGIEKVIKRHPHIFGDVKLETASEVVEVWEKRKKKDWKDEGKELPALLRAFKIQRRAKRKGFDWEDVSGVYEKLKEELEELKNAENKMEEYGDLLFVVTHIGNFLGINPEVALRKACDKFSRRFSELEKIAKTDDLKKYSLKKLDELWNKVKEKEKG